MDDVVSGRGRRVPINIEIDDDGVLVSAENEGRKVVVMSNLGPDTAWGGQTLEEANPDTGFPLVSGAGIVDDASMDAWYFSTATGESANIRGWEVSRV